MRVYVDTSVILRFLLGQEPRFVGWGDWHQGFTSRLAEVEIGRAIDRLRLAGSYTDIDVAMATQEAGVLMNELSVIEVSQRVLDVARRPMPTVVGTFDAIHLASAVELRPLPGAALLFVTHDRRQRLGALGLGMAVAGDEER